jgi:hypothetical protein
MKQDFQINKLYKHSNNKDVAMYILSVEKAEEGVYIQCKWYNLLYKGFCTNQIDKVTITNNQIDNWSELDV